MLKYVKRKLGRAYGRFVVARRCKALARAILSDARSNPEKYVDPELASALEHVTGRGAEVFPCDFSREHSPRGIKVSKDATGLPYVMHEGKRLFFPRTMGRSDVRRCYCALLREQDPRSPHCYTSPDFGVENGATLFDVGCAEGIFALTHVERVARALLFESDPAWMEALKATFAPWGDRVLIFDKYASDRDSEGEVTLDTVARTYAVRGDIFIKMDVEGAEMRVLAGAAGTLAAGGGSVRAAVCTYHNAGDYVAVERTMSSAGFSVTPSFGYMLFVYDPSVVQPPYFRRGVARCGRTATTK